MKKLGLIVLLAGIVLMAGCAGDDPVGPTGTLETVTGLTIDASSAGRNVDLSWNAISEDVDGYKIYFRANSTGAWTDSVDVTSGTSGQHANAISAGYYTVKAYEGNNYSENNSNIVNTLPVDDTTTYMIYDNYSAATAHSAFIFGTAAGGGQTGLASNTGFVQDIYAWDLTKGDSNVWLLSGNWGTYGNGRQTYMFEPENAGYCNVYGSGTWYSESYKLLAGDERVYLYLHTGDYVKIYDLNVQPDVTEHGTTVSFSYEIQTLTGLTLFTSN